MKAITDGVLKVIEEAINNPQTFFSGRDRKKLQATFDAATVQIIKFILKKSYYGSRLNARNLINSREKSNFTSKENNVLEALAEALRNDEGLFAKSYTDHGENITLFVANHLKTLFDKLKELD